MPKSVCYKCTKRHMHCHDTCPSWADEKAKQAVAKSRQEAYNEYGKYKTQSYNEAAIYKKTN